MPSIIPYTPPNFPPKKSSYPFLYEPFRLPIDVKEARSLLSTAYNIGKTKYKRRIENKYDKDNKETIVAIIKAGKIR